MMRTAKQRQRRDRLHLPSHQRVGGTVSAAALFLSLLLTTTSLLVAAKKQPSSSSSSSPSTANIWQHIEQGASDPILGIAQAYRECTAENKITVCIGAYRDNDGQPWILPSVREAERRLLENPAANKEYLPIEGDMEFVELAVKFAYGEQQQHPPIAAIQTLSGTGACRIGGEFLARHYRPPLGSAGTKPTIYIPVPTWGNHWKIFNECGLHCKPYRYYDYATNKLDFKGMCEDLGEAPDGSIILLHACAHNPTGCDPSTEEWDAIFNICSEKFHVCFFDSAYQGFASGDSEQDAQTIRRAVARGDLAGIMLAQSFAKNFGLYGERCGTLSIVCHDEQQRAAIISQLRLIVRPMYSSPPKHGAAIVKTVLSDPRLSEQYYVECASMAERIQQMRQLLVDELANVGSTHDWSHITSQIGMFAYTGMSAEMCEALMETPQYAIYLTKDGRISMAGLNEHNYKRIAQAIHEVTDGKSITK